MDSRVLRGIQGEEEKDFPQGKDRGFPHLWFNEFKRYSKKGNLLRICALQTFDETQDWNQLENKAHTYYQI